MNSFFQRELAKYLLSIVLLVLMAAASLAQDTDKTSESHQRIANRFVSILNEQWGIEKEKISGKTSFLRDFGADSMDIMELVMALEEDFDIEILDEEWERVTTVDSAVELILDKKERRYRWQY